MHVKNGNTKALVFEGVGDVWCADCMYTAIMLPAFPQICNKQKCQICFTDSCTRVNICFDIVVNFTRTVFNKRAVDKIKQFRKGEINVLSMLFDKMTTLKTFCSSEEVFVYF